jgi:hypothetical protein
LRAKASRQSHLRKAEVLAFSTGLAGCLMMVYAFTYIIMYGHAIFVEPNRILADLELSVFGVGGAANLAVVVNRLRR